MPPTVTLARAVELCGVSRSTIQRRRTELIKLGAQVTPRGWSIPIPALITAGLLDSVTPPDSVAKPVAETPKDTPSGTRSDTSEIDALRAKLAETESRLAVAEALADERRAALEMATLAMKMIEAKKHPEPATPEVPRRRWWQRTPQG